MELTYKAVALMCGFKLQTYYANLKCIHAYVSPDGYKTSGFQSQEEAAKHCCIEFGLVKPESDY